VARDDSKSKNVPSSITFPGVISATGTRLRLSVGLLFDIANKIRF